MKNNEDPEHTKKSTKPPTPTKAKAVRTRIILVSREECSIRTKPVAIHIFDMDIMHKHINCMYAPKARYGF